MTDDLPDDFAPKHPLEYFHAGVPPFSLFIQSLDDIHEVVKTVDPHKDLEDWEMEEYGGVNTV